MFQIFTGDLSLAVFKQITGKGGRSAIDVCRFWPIYFRKQFSVLMVVAFTIISQNGIF